MKSLISGEKKFLDYYGKIFNWAKNKESANAVLGKKNRPILIIVNNNLDKIKSLWSRHNINLKPLMYFPTGIKWPDELALGDTLPGFKEGLFYPINEASLLPVLALNIKKGETILDACAAPGGKSIAISSLVICKAVQNVRLVSNDASPSRIKRLHTAIKTFGLKDIVVTNRKAQLMYQRFPEAFDKILLDAPCSSEKHLWQNKTELNKWTPTRIKRNAQTQYMLISSLALALKKGGRLIYSTCALTPEENELVVKRVLERKSDLLKLAPLPAPSYAMTPTNLTTDKTIRELTWRVLPNEKSELDPMFVAAFDRI